jgi:DNA-binding transcriptional LysR family regulator
MDYNRVALFVRVVHTGSFTAAAAELRLPKSSVSRGISRLEEELGVRLLQRTTRKLSLTEVGQHYYEAVSGSVHKIDEADSIAKEQAGEPRGTVRMTAPPELNLAGLLVAFHRKYPGILVEVSLTSRRVDLITEGFDLALRGGRLDDSTLVARRIVFTPLILVASPSYLRAHGRPKSVTDLQHHDFVLYKAKGGAATVQVQRERNGQIERASVEVRGTLVADDLGFVLDAVVAGAGIGFLPLPVLADQPGAVVPVLPGWTDEGKGGISVVMPTAEYVPARVLLLRDFLVEHLSRQHRRANELSCSLARGKRRRARIDRVTRRRIEV